MWVGIEPNKDISFVNHPFGNISVKVNSGHDRYFRAHLRTNRRQKVSFRIFYVPGNHGPVKVKENAVHRSRFSWVRIYPYGKRLLSAALFATSGELAGKPAVDDEKGAGDVLGVVGCQKQ